jgi:hypothetical protein
MIFAGICHRRYPAPLGRPVPGASAPPLARGASAALNSRARTTPKGQITRAPFSPHLIYIRQGRRHRRSAAPSGRPVPGASAPPLARGASAVLKRRERAPLKGRAIRAPFSPPLIYSCQGRRHRGYPAPLGRPVPGASAPPPAYQGRVALSPPHPAITNPP